MTTYKVLVEGDEQSFEYTFDGKPKIDLTFEANGTIYKVTTRSHDEDDTNPPTLHACVI